MEVTQPPIRLAFERKLLLLSIDGLFPLKPLRAKVKESKKYLQILASVRTIGVVEPPAVIPDPQNAGSYLLLDGHLRIEALKELSITEVLCLVATEDETYTYNKRTNRMSAAQEHKMVVRAMDRGVSVDKMARALGLDPASIRRRSRLLEGICPEAENLLKDTSCAMAVFDVLRMMKPIRQIVAAEIMTGQGNYTAAFARTILVATPADQLVAPSAPSKAKTNTVEHMARLEKELIGLQSQVKAVEDSYGIDNLHLTVSQGYLRKLLSNGPVVRWLSRNRPEYLEQFQSIAEITALPTITPADA
ncbi:plasmid partitioning protein RepB C-terminal domain-containing protein [Sphingobium subterraneum]|uniref:RepB plasmid partition domain-containing protein n=1 Tax=Sphingobium subterraneum TaxID=627688 RepID=A0A841J3I8_9SPHN|nr:hypothetical protein [Sphingobium subterraneum]